MEGFSATQRILLAMAAAQQRVVPELVQDTRLAAHLSMVEHGKERHYGIHVGFIIEASTRQSPKATELLLCTTYRKDTSSWDV